MLVACRTARAGRSGAAGAAGLEWNGTARKESSMDHAAPLALLLAADQPPANGIAFRIFIVVSVVGAVLLAWFLLRGYRNNG